MNAVFVDTAAWIGLINAKDTLHVRTQKIYRDLLQNKVPLVTTDFVLLEVADALSAPALRAATVGFINRLRTTMEIVPVSEDLLARGWALYSQRADKDWGLSDCTSFVVMQERQIAEAFTSDRHFEQSGFTRLL